MTEYATTVLLDGLKFTEGPRWHEGRLWFSDMWANRVMAVDPAGRSEVIVEVSGRPSGLGWLPDGRLLVVSMADRKLMRLERDGLREHADLSPVATSFANDMVVDGQGRAYVGNFGADLIGETFRTAALALVSPGGDVRVAAEELEFPNGAVITPDGATLVVAESRGRRLTAFRIAVDGTLTDRRVFAELGDVVPDGICLDAEGAIWVANPRARECVRVHEGGAVTDRAVTQHPAYACMLGGEDGRTLFVCTSDGSEEDRRAARSAAFIETATVAVSRAGWP